MKIEFNEREPIYIQIINHIKTQIASSNIKGGDKLPSVRELSVEIKVNPNTIQRAYGEIEREGLAYTKRGMGKFVTEDDSIIKKLKVHMAKDVLEKFMNEMNHLGFTKNEIIQMVSIKVEGGCGDE